MMRVTILLLFISLHLNAQESFVPESYNVPYEKEFAEYVFLKVDPKYSERDYDALMSARVFIRDKLGTSWPSDTFSLEENTLTLKRDLEAFDLRTNFTFHILDKSKSKVIGCFYISPTTDVDFDAAVFVWVAEEYLSTKLFKDVKLDINSWLSKSWPFKNVDFFVDQ